MRESPNPTRTISPFTHDDIVFAPHRRLRPRGRTINSCPLCEEGKDSPVIIPNKYPSLTDKYMRANSLIAGGFCGVIIYGNDHDRELLRPNNVGSVVLGKIFSRAKNDFENYPFIVAFENRGNYFGASLSHPHAQYWAMAWIPHQQEIYWENFKQNTCLFCQSKSRDLIVYEDSLVVAEVNPYAVLPYEIFIYLKSKHKLPQKDELDALNKALQSIYQAIENHLGGKFDNSLIAWHLAPRGDFEAYHFHISVHIPHETPANTKVFGGIEFLTRTYVNSFPPEEVAKMIRVQMQAEK